METIYVASSQELMECVSAIKAETSFLAIDTEFRRESTYFPELSLIQIATTSHVFLVDALAVPTLSPLFECLLASLLPKVLHSGRQDLEIFCNLMQGNVLTNVFDTQIAATFLGYGESAGFEALVQKVLGTALDKTSRKTDWMSRPLTEDQRQYAANDVVYLRPLYEEFISKLEAKDRLSWMPIEMQPLMQHDFLITNPDEAWLRFKLNNQPDEYVGVVQAVAKWREITAQQTNVPRAWVLKDDIVLRLASKRPEHSSDLRAVVGEEVSQVFGDELMAVLTDAYTQGLSENLELQAVITLSKQQHMLLDLLKVLLKVVSLQVGLNAKLIASKENLQAFIRSKNAECFGESAGWRYTVFWSRARALIEGDLAIHVQNGKVVLDDQKSLDVSA